MTHVLQVWLRQHAAAYSAQFGADPCWQAIWTDPPGQYRVLVDWLCYVGVYVTVFSILCSLSSFLFFPICLVAIIFWWIKIYIHCVPKKHVTTFLMISWSRTVGLERFLAHLLLRVQAIDRCFYFPTSPILCSYFTLGNCHDLNISKN